MNFHESGASTPRRFTSLGVVALLHVGLAWVLASGMAHHLVTVLRPPLETRIVEDRPPPPPPPPREKLMPTPLKVPPPPFVPPPEVAVQTPPSPAAITAVSAVRSETPAVMPGPVRQDAPPVREPVRVEAVVDARNCKKPEYPAHAIRERWEGRVKLMLLVGEDGKVKQSRVERSSGHPELDAAAQAALSLCLFKPGTVDGRPEASWTDLEYVWRLY